MSKHIIYGAPGTGKTTRLLSILEEHFNKGLRPEEVCFCSFSKASANEAKERAIIKFGITKESIPNFGTIHSICYRNLFLGVKLVKLSAFFNQEKIEYEETKTDEDILTNAEIIKENGNVIINFYDKLRLNFMKNIFNIGEKELKEMFYQLPMADEDYEILFANSFNLYKVLVDYENFKIKNKVIDFIDMLLKCKELKWNVPTKILIVDEFQDLSPLQYEIYNIWCQEKEEVYIAGDDDQTIYSFICANPNFLLSEKGSINKEKGDEEITLDKTYRLPENIHSYCLNYIRSYIKGKRIDKEVISMKDGGEIIEEEIDGNLRRVLEFIRKDKFTYILFRTNYYKKLFINSILVPTGVIYDEIRGMSLWNKKTISLFNACIKLVNNKPLNYNETKYLIESIPFKLGLLSKGLKSKFKDMRKEEEYNFNDLLKIGVKLELFNYLCYEKLYYLLDLKEKVKEAFDSTKKEIIQYPIKIKIGTIHSSKGKEAEDVIIFKDIPLRVYNEINNKEENWDNEIRVFFVGMTRAKERLVILRGGFYKSESNIIP